MTLRRASSSLSRSCGIRPDIATNLVINTDRRTYHLELRANPSVYMASVSWTYPQDDPPRVMRLSRKAISIASACGSALIGGALIYALHPECL
jgi:hypothetical protein